jgi:hypothetical protein
MAFRDPRHCLALSRLRLSVPGKSGTEEGAILNRALSGEVDTGSPPGKRAKHVCDTKRTR